MKLRVLVTAPPILPSIFNYKNIFDERNIEIVVPPFKVTECLYENELIDLLHNIDGILCGDDKLTAEVLKRSKKLKVISKWGTGIDSIDSEAAKELGIKVFRVKNVFSDPVSDTVMAYILQFSRRIFEKDKLVRNGKWEKTKSYTLKERTLGVIGLGHIGNLVVQKALAFGMEVYVNDIKKISDDILNSKKIKVVELNELIKKSDFITLHCDLNKTSFHLIDKEQINLMKEQAIIINTSRGEVINQVALEDALENNKIGGAALDVFEKEPLPENNKLRSLQNVFLSPHNSNGSPSVFEKVNQRSIENIFIGLSQK